MKTWAVGSLGIACLMLLICLGDGQAQSSASSYKSPYSVKFTHPVSELLADLEHGPRADPHNQSDIPFNEWNSPRVRKEYGSWGPRARHYPAPQGVLNRPTEWQRERVIAVALRYQGYAYQHHHIPDWQPPASWPWKETAAGHNSKGLDCSNFSAFVYNQGFGIKPSGNVKEQAEQLTIPGPGPGRTLRAELIQKPECYAELTKTLKTGDLLYIRNNAGALAHVIIWVGPIGQSSDGDPLIIDSHGEGVKDSEGQPIPVGIHLRPFREKSWYYRSFSHAHRLLKGE